EHALSAKALDDLFERTAQSGYTRELLFSTTVDLMSLVVCGVAPHSTVKWQGKPEREKFFDRPDVVGPASRHGGRPLLPLLALLLPQTQTAGDPAEIVHTAHQIHPLLEQAFVVHPPPAAPCQGRHRCPERGVDPLDVR